MFNPKSKEQIQKKSADKATRIFEHDLENRIEEVIRDVRKSGKDLTPQDLEKKLKEAYVQVWNNYVANVGLSGMTMNPNGTFKYSVIQTKQIANIQSLNDRQRDTLFDTLSTLDTISKTKNPNYQEMKKELAALKGEILSTQIHKIIDQYTESFNWRGKPSNEASHELKEALDILNTLKGVHLGTIEETAMDTLRNNQADLNTTVKDQAAALHDAMKEPDFNKNINKHKFMIKAAFCVVAAAAIVTAIVAAVLLSEVIAGVAIGGSVGAAISTFVTTQAPAFTALIGVAVPLETAKLAVGAIAAGAATVMGATSAVGLMSNYAENRSVHSAMNTDKIQEALGKTVEQLESNVGALVSATQVRDASISK